MKFFYKNNINTTNKNFDNIHEIKWDDKNNKIIGYKFKGSFPFPQLVDGYYDFLKKENDKSDKNSKIELPKNAEEKVNVILDVIKNGNCFIYYDQKNNKIAGFIQYKISNDIAHIVELFVTDDYLRKGIGTQLLQFAEQKIKSKNINQITVFCQDKNSTGDRFYKAMKYKEITKEELDKLMNNKKEDRSTEENKWMAASFEKTNRYRYNNKNSVRIYRNYKCLDCGQRFEKFDQLLKHATRQHKSLIGDMDPYRYLYEKRNPGPYICLICHKRERVWNDKKHKYNRICNNPECAKKAREIFSKNMKRIYGTDNLAKDPEYQAMLVANRHISGIYKFKDGNSLSYVGEYEKDFLKHCEEAFEFDSTDICDVPKEFYIQYFDPTLNRLRWYIEDFYLPKFNLIIEIKDASKYPLDSKALMRLKENAVIKANKFNYIKIVEKDYKDFDDFIKSSFENNYSIEKHDNEFTIIIPEIK